MWRKGVEPSCFVDRNVKWWSHYGKQVFYFLRFLKKIENRTTIWSSHLTSGYVSKVNEIRILIRYLHFPILCSIIHNSQDMETIYCIDEWIKNVAYICSRILFSHKKKIVIVVQSLSHVWLFATPWLQNDRLFCRSLSPRVAHTHVHWADDAIQPSHPLPPPSPHDLNPPQHQSLFKWVSSLLHVALVLELQLQHQSFQWIFRTYFL